MSLLGAGETALAQTGSSTVTPPAPPPPKTVRRRPPPKVVEPKTGEPPPSASLDEILEGKDKTGTPVKPPSAELLGEQVVPPGEERPVPNYDSREEAPLSAGEFLIWIPRIIFFPVHLVFEYLIRWPLVTGLTWAEEVYLFKRIEEFFTWRDGKSGIYPTFFADFGLKPSVGLTTFHNDFPVEGNSFNASFGWWYPNWYNVQARNRTTVLSDDTGKFDVTGFFVSRPDYPFWGIGANTNGEINPPFRYDRRQTGGGLAFLAALGGLSRLKFAVDYRWVDFEDEPDIDDDEEEESPLNGSNLMVPGFNAGDLAIGTPDGLGRYHLIDTRAELKIDTRHPDTEFEGGTGVLLELFGGFAFNPGQTGINFVRWGGEAAAFYDFTDLGHVLALRLHTEFLVRTGADVRGEERNNLPFTELPSLGGLETMPGYLAGRFLGDSALDATLSYRYPVWSLLIAEVFAGVGNAYEGHFGIDEGADGATDANFTFDRLYFNAGFGLRTSLDRDRGLQLLVAFGTNRLDGGDGDGGQGLRVDSVRFAFGLAEGF